MGLTLRAVSKDYGYDEEKDEDIGEVYSSTDTGYGSFRAFRNNLIKWATNDAADDNSLFINNKILPGEESFFSRRPADEFLAYCFYDSEDFVIRMELEEGSKESQQNPKFINYIKKLEFLKEAYPKLYTLYPFVYHCDCEGKMPLNQCKQILPLIKEFHEFDKRSYGYSGWEYNFVKDFIQILEDVVNHEGELDFS
jgi:hypothetical protein